MVAHCIVATARGHFLVQDDMHPVSRHQRPRTPVVVGAGSGDGRTLARTKEGKSNDGCILLPLYCRCPTITIDIVEPLATRGLAGGKMPIEPHASVTPARIMTTDQVEHGDDLI